VKIEEIRSKTESELDYELGQMKKELFELRFKASTASAANPARIAVLKRGIARVITVLNERTKGIAREPAQSARRKR
jgi:large subunit ribosomal protein L29